MCPRYSGEARLAQSTQQIATGWMVLGSNPGGSKNFLCIFVQTGPDAHQHPLPLIPGLFTRGKGARARHWSSALINCWDYAWVELYLHSPLYVSHVMLQSHFTFIIRYWGESIQMNIYLTISQFRKANTMKCFISHLNFAQELTAWKLKREARWLELYHEENMVLLVHAVHACTNIV